MATSRTKRDEELALIDYVPPHNHEIPMDIQKKLEKNWNQYSESEFDIITNEIQAFMMATALELTQQNMRSLNDIQPMKYGHKWAANKVQMIIPESVGSMSDIGTIRAKANSMEAIMDWNREQMILKKAKIPVGYGRYHN